MQAQRRRDTRCELALRRALWRRGLRYRVHRRALADVRRDADVLFRRSKVAVFVDGCFWHGCPEHKTTVRANKAWWAEKIARTIARDRDTDARLVAAGWTVVRVWEHSDPERAAEAISALVCSAHKPRRLVI